MPEPSHPTAPRVVVDLVLLALLPAASDTGASLGVVTVRGADGLRGLPGRALEDRQTAGDSMRALLTEQLDLRLDRALALDLLGVYDDPARDPGGWTLSLAYVTSLREDEVATLHGEQVETLAVRGPAERGHRVTDAPLRQDHDEMKTTAVRRLRRRYERSPDPLQLGRSPFTLDELRRVHEAVLDVALDPAAFAQRMERYLVPATSRTGHPLHRSVEVDSPLFRRRTRADRAAVR